jgi:hypothetical protein
VHLATILQLTMTPFFLCAEFGGPILAPELTDEIRAKMTGSLNSSSFIQSISFVGFDLVGQGKYLHLTSSMPRE